VRAANKLPPLYNDTILYNASLFHCDYLKGIGKITHFQKKRKKTYDAQQRAKYFGATDYRVGENIATTLYGKSIKLSNKEKILTNT